MRLAALFVAAFACSAAGAAVPPACRVKPTDPMSDPAFLRQGASIMMAHGDDHGLEYLQLANDAQREIDLRETACVVCGNAGFAEGSIEKSNCIADQVQRNRPPARPRKTETTKPETTTECRPDYVGGFVCRTH